VALPTARHAALTLALPGGVEMCLAWIAPGSFLMGAGEGEAGLADESPRRRVTLRRGFWLGVFPVTQEQYLAVAGDNPSRFRGDPRRPVERVTVADCLRFCRLLSGCVGAPVRLPTEAEWEYCCRAGTATAYPFPARDLAKHAWFADNAGGTTQAVGTRRPNPWGLHDLMGNVAEWCLDGYDRYPTEEVCDPFTAERLTHVLRGGSWQLPAWACRSACRGAQPPEARGAENGFRVLLADR
jgi:formylglycine-generating enzyme required for sulfatase activity